MSEKIGKLLSCDRCGKKVFLRYINTNTYDGGYSKVDNFEKQPEGWVVGWGVGMLCPECHAKYDDLVDTFMNEDDEHDWTELSDLRAM